MRKFFSFSAILAVAALALISCQSEKDAPAKLDPSAKFIRVHATAQDLSNDGTKTYLGTDPTDDTPNTVLWGTGEYMKLAVTAGETTTWATSTDNSADLFEGKASALFEFSVTPGEATSYKYQGLYPASAAVASNNTKPESFKVELPASQNATATTYDPSAYILVAKPETFDVVETEWEVSFRRATALNKVTLKNVDGLSIKKVKITVPEGKYLAGRRYFDLTTTVKADVLGEIYTGGGRTETVDVKYATPLTGANVDVWFTSWGVELAEGETLTVVAYTTDKKSYTRTITIPANRFINFKEGYLNTVGIDMSSATEAEVNELDEGNYVVLAKDGDNYYALKAEKEENKERLLSVEYTGDLTSYSGTAEIIWTATKSGDSYIFENSGKYLGYKGSSNESYWLAADENWTETNYLLDVTAQTTAGLYYVTLHSNSARYLSKNGNSAFFAFYGNTNQKANIVFVPATVDNRADAKMAWSETSATATITNAGVSFTAPTLTLGNAHDVTYNSTDTSVATIDDQGEVEVLAEGTTKIQAIFAGDTDYLPATVEYTLTVTDETVPVSYDFETVAELNALVTSESDTFEGYLTDAVVSFVPATNTAIVKDATGSIMFYKMNHGLKQGQTYTGAINVTAVQYNSLYSEVTVWDANFTGTETAVAPESVSLADVVGNFDDYQNAYVSIAGLTVESVSGKNIDVTDGTNTYVVYDHPGTATCSEGDVITAVGTITKFQTTEELKVWAASDITITASTPKAITFTQPTAGGAITVSVGGSAITSGTKVSSGTTVTLSATVADGYTFGSWTVNGATVANASNAETTFTMGTSAVSVSASFTSTSGGGTTTTYTKVTSAPSDWSGTYIIVYESSSTSGLVCLAGTDSYQNYTTATINSSVISSNDLADYEVTIASAKINNTNGYSIKALGGNNKNKYLEGKGSSSNGTSFATTPGNLTSFSLSNGVVSITNNTNLFVYNSTSGSNGERWRFYKSKTAAGDAYKKPALYKKN